MNKSIFCESQIVDILKEAEHEVRGNDLCKKQGISELTRLIHPADVNRPGL
jgi:hypothetical protein